LTGQKFKLPQPAVSSKTQGGCTSLKASEQKPTEILSQKPGEMQIPAVICRASVGLERIQKESSERLERL